MSKSLRLIITITITAQILISCVTWKSSLNANGGNYNAAYNAIKDFCNTCTLAKKDKTFYININEQIKGIINVHISGTTGRFFVFANDPRSNWPSNYIEYDNKLFYWYEDSLKSDLQVIFKLNEYHLIDSVNSISDAIFNIDDGKKGMAYYFCKNNMLNYRKQKTYGIRRRVKDIPRLNCK